MPIQIEAPLPNNPFGPGWLWAVNSGTTDPGFGPWHWEIQLKDDLGDFSYGFETHPTTNPSTTLGGVFQSEAFPAQLQHQFATGQPGRFQVELHNNAGLVEQQVVPIVEEFSDGQLILLRQQGTGTVTGGFTETDREQLNVTAAAVQVPFPINTTAGGIVNSALGSLVRDTPIGLLSRQECRSITGNGSLTRPGGTFAVNAAGFSWRFVSIPTNYGRTPGAQLELEQRIVQFVVHQADFTGADHIVRTVDAHTDQELVTWGLLTPSRVEYAVAPGCVVEFCWLLFLGS